MFKLTRTTSPICPVVSTGKVIVLPVIEPLCRVVLYNSTKLVFWMYTTLSIVILLSTSPLNSGKPNAINNNYKKGELYVNKGSKIYIPEDTDIPEATAEIQKEVERLWQENKDAGAIIRTKTR